MADEAHERRRGSLKNGDPSGDWTTARRRAPGWRAVGTPGGVMGRIRKKLAPYVQTCGQIGSRSGLSRPEEKNLGSSGRINRVVRRAGSHHDQEERHNGHVAGADIRSDQQHATGCRQATPRG